MKDSLLTAQPVDPGRNYLKSAWTRCSTPTPTTYMKRVQSIYIYNKGMCEYERRGVKYITRNKIRKERRNFFLDKGCIKLVGMKAPIYT